MLYLQNVWLLLFTQIDQGSFAVSSSYSVWCLYKVTVAFVFDIPRNWSPNKDVRWHNRRIKVAHNLQPSVTRHSPRSTTASAASEPSIKVFIKFQYRKTESRLRNVSGQEIEFFPAWPDPHAERETEKNHRQASSDAAEHEKKWRSLIIISPGRRWETAPLLCCRTSKMEI